MFEGAQASIIAYTEDRKKAQRRYQAAVKQAAFLDEQQKLNWSTMGMSLPTEQLEHVCQMIVEENLKNRKTKGALEVLKTKNK